MKNREKIILGITSAAAAIGIIVYLSKKIKTTRMLDQIAYEGYETAGDILFPLKGKRRWGRKFGSNRWENELFY